MEDLITASSPSTFMVSWIDFGLIVAAWQGRDEVTIGSWGLRLIGYVSIRADHYYPWNETSTETTNRTKKIASLTTSICRGYPSIVTRRADDAINTYHRHGVQLGDDMRRRRQSLSVRLWLWLPHDSLLFIQPRTSCLMRWRVKTICMPPVLL